MISATERVPIDDLEERVVVLAALAMAYGLMLSTVILPRRFTSIGTHGATA